MGEDTRGVVVMGFGKSSIFESLKLSKIIEK